jgi:hypothetical protein
MIKSRRIWTGHTVYIGKFLFENFKTRHYLGDLDIKINIKGMLKSCGDVDCIHAPQDRC